jgi:predicted  nucleic acid-binding Zn-ribbon protein
MKFLVILLLVAISLERTEKKLKRTATTTKTSEKAKSTACDAGVYDVTISCGTDYGTNFTASLDAKDLESPSVGNIRGLVLSNVPTSGTCSLFSTFNTTTLIEYALTNTFTGTQPSASGYYITSSAYIADSVVPFMITFNYNEKWPYITSEIFTKIVTWINANQASRQTNINDYKTGAVDAATNYISLSSIVANATLNSTVVATEITDLTSKISALNTTIINLQKNYTTVDALLTSAESDYNTAASTTSSLQTSASTAKAEKQALEKLLKQVDTDYTSSVDSATTYKSNYDTAYSNMQTINSTYYEEMAQLKSTWSTALSTFISKRDKDSYLTTIKSCLQVS